jgi:antitoxin PrlF
MSIVTVSEKGQMVIPSELRRRLGIVPGTRLEVIPESSGFRVLVDPRRKTRTAAECIGIFGSLNGAPVSVEQLSGIEAARRLAKRGKIKL